MQALCNDSELRAQYGKNARATFLGEFQFDRIVKERFIPLYEN